MLVEVRPLPVKKWHGKKDKEAFAQPKAIEVLYSSKTGTYNTGLTEEEEEKYGKLLGVDLTSKFEYEKAHPYWSTKPAWIVLPNHTTIFNTDKAADYVKIKNMKASPSVANSMKEYEDGLFPNATHVIFDEAEEVENKSAKIALEDAANQIKYKMSDEDKINMVQLLSDKNKSVRGMSPSFISVEINDIIKVKPEEFIRVAKMGREEITVRAKVMEMVAKNILTKEAGAYYYMGDMVGADYESTVAWFRDPQNSKMKILIQEKLLK